MIQLFKGQLLFVGIDFQRLFTKLLKDDVGLSIY
jgi:hypothetical protein